MPASLSAPADARAYRRLCLELEVTLESDSNFYMGLTENLSDGGIFVATHAIQPIGTIVALTLRINDFLTGLFLGVGITLVDFKLEFGRLWENDEMRIVLADEISPDNCRLWDSKTNEKMDKDRFRRDMGKVEEAYQEVAKRLGILPEAGVRDLKGPELMQ